MSRETERPKPRGTRTVHPPKIERYVAVCNSCGFEEAPFGTIDCPRCGSAITWEPPSFFTERTNLWEERAKNRKRRAQRPRLARGTSPDYPFLLRSALDEPAAGSKPHPAAASPLPEFSADSGTKTALLLRDRRVGALLVLAVLLGAACIAVLLAALL